MKKTGVQQLRDMSLEQLIQKEVELRQELLSQRLHHATKPIKDHQSGKKLRRDIARVLTFITSKQAESVKG